MTPPVDDEPVVGDEETAEEIEVATGPLGP